ncbi:hypothetical protein SUGI_0546790 [Cryptomeria japonica]|nr:hypothetical protein SUGI_0546790 [Cryptomeria japonica]
MSTLDIASAAAQDKPDCAKILQRLEAAGAIRSSLKPTSSTKSSLKSNDSKKEIDTDDINTHMLVASLIATVTFAAMFQIPGGTEDDKESIHYGAAKLAFGKVFRLFLFSDTVAFLASLTVVVGWLLRRHLPGSRLRSFVSSCSEESLLVSIFWTVVAFASTTITVIIPHNLDSLKIKDKEAFSKYQQLLGYEISLLPSTPYLVAASLFSVSLLSNFQPSSTIQICHKTSVEK